MSVVITLKITYSNVYQAPQAHNSLGLEIITTLKKLKQKTCSVVNTKTMPLAWAPGNY